MKSLDHFTFRPNLLVHNIRLPYIQSSSTFVKMARQQQDKADGITLEESIPYPKKEEERSDKQQKVSRGRNSKVNTEHKRAKKDEPEET